MTTFAQPFADYEILDRVGGGAMGTVFKARHKRLNRIVALKVLKPSLARDKRYVDRLRREARIVASLSHPYIVTGYDLGEEGGYHFFVMEFVEGRSLRQLLVEWGMFAEDYVVTVARQVAEALDHAYQRDVIHRDIKPGNILIDDAGKVKLTDMGLAKGPADLTLTRDGATVGTPMYISPEQARNPQDVDVRSDLYSLGATLYHMSTGMPPFSGETMAELITNVLNENVVPPNEANSAVSEQVSLVIRKLLAKNLTLRYQTPRELLDDLDRIERSQPVAVDKNRLDEAEHETNRVLRVVLVTLCAVLLATGAWWVGKQMVEPTRQEDPDEYLAQLDRDLQELGSPGQRYLRLTQIADPPTGTVAPIAERTRRLVGELQHRVDAVVDQFEGRVWRDVEKWLRDPKQWPDLSEFDREWLHPRLREATGVTWEHLPVSLRQRRVDQLRHAVEQAIRRRDQEFLAKFEHFVSTVLPARADERTRLGDFAEADRLWRDALPFWCNGLLQMRPLPELLAEPVRIRVDGLLDAARTEAVGAIDRAESAAVESLRDEVDATTADVVAELGQGAAPHAVEELLQRFRRDLMHFWPPASNFRIGRNPWPHVDSRLKIAQDAIELRRLVLAEEHVARRFELAWRAFVRGDGEAGRAVLADLQPAVEAQETKLHMHRRMFDAVVEVEQALLETIAARNERPIGFTVYSLEPHELRAVADGERLRLTGAVSTGPPRAMRLTELRLGDLLRVLSVRTSPPLQRLPDSQLALGLAVLRLCSEDLQDLEGDVSELAPADRAFLFDELWPMLERARGGSTSRELDVDGMFAELERSLDALEHGGPPEPVRVVVKALESRADQRISGRQRSLLRRAKERYVLALRERELLEEVRDRAPRGADVAVGVDGGELFATVSLGAEALHGGSGEGWEVRGNALEFAGGDRPWSEQPRLALRLQPGLQQKMARGRCELQLAFPERGVGSRLYLVAFYGTAFAIYVDDADVVHAAPVEGALVDANGGMREDRAQRAFLTAMSGAIGKPGSVASARVVAVAGGQHRLTIDVRPSLSRTQANLVVAFEGEPLIRDTVRDYDPASLPDLHLHPLQEVSVWSAMVRLSGM